MHAQKYYFNASEVAALLGMHTYKPRCAAILLYMQGQSARGSDIFPQDMQRVLENAQVQAALNKFAMAKAVGPQMHAMEAADTGLLDEAAPEDDGGRADALLELEGLQRLQRARQLLQHAGVVG